MNLAAVMDELAERLDEIDGLRVFPYPPTKPPSPPAAIVTYPGEITFDATYGRGMDRVSGSVVVLVGNVVDRVTRDRIAAYSDGDGPKSIKQKLEGAEYASFDSLRVTGIEFDTVTIGAVDFLSATFTLDIAGQGTE